MSLFGFFTGRRNKYDPTIQLTQSNALTSIVTDDELEVSKLRRYEEAWRAYKGLNLNKEDPVKTSGNGSQGHTHAKINYTEVVVRRLRSFCFGKRWKLTIDEKPEQEELEEMHNDPASVQQTELSPEQRQQRAKLEEMVRFADDVFHKRNPGDKLRLKNALFASVTGDCYFVAMPILPESLELDMFGKATNINQSKIRVMCVNSAFAKPTYGPDGESMVRFEMEYGVALPDGSPGKFRQIITPSQVQETTFNAEGSQVRERTVANPIGRVYAVHITNLPNPGKYGDNDVDMIKGAVQELNDKSSEISDIIDYHSAPVTIIYGARVSTLEKGANKLWSGLPATARVENLKLEGDLDAMNTYMESLRSMIKEASGVNEAALGSDLQISNTSGVALHTRFFAMSSIALEKWSSWDQGIKALMYIILLWGRHLNKIEFTDDDLDRLEDVLTVIFSTNLPKDELLEIQKNTEMVRSGLKPKMRAIADLGSKNPRADMRLIQKERAAGGEIRLAPSSDPDIQDTESGSTGSNVSSFRAPTEASQNS